jgi:hypothetical protein
VDTKEVFRSSKFKKKKQYASQKERTTIDKIILKHEKEKYRLSNMNLIKIRV